MPLVILLVVVIIFALYLIRKIAWKCIKENKIETAENLQGFNKGMHEIVTKGVRIARDASVNSSAFTRKITPAGLLCSVFFTGADVVLNKFDSASLIRKGMKKEVEEVLQFIELLSHEAKHQSVRDFLANLRQDVLDRRNLIENIEEIRDIAETLKYISNIRSDAKSASGLSDEDLGDLENEATKDYYGIFGINRDATLDEIKKAYRLLAQKYHPDKNPEGVSDEMFKTINKIYQVLKDPVRRREYDDSLV